MDDLLEQARALTRAEDERQRRLVESVGVTRAQGRVLREAEGRRSVARIARRFGLSRQSVQRTADSLVERDLCRYAPNPEHARSPLLELTEAGRARLVELNRRAEAAGDDELAVLFEPEELETALQVLRAVRDGLETR